LHFNKELIGRSRLRAVLDEASVEIVKATHSRALSNFHASEEGEDRIYRGSYDFPAKGSLSDSDNDHARPTCIIHRIAPPKTPPRARVKVDSTRVGMDTSMARRYDEEVVLATRCSAKMRLTAD